MLPSLPARAVLFVVLFAFGVGCRPARPGALPGGGTAWSALRSERFVLHTDRDVTTSRVLFDQLEATHAAMARVAFPGRPAEPELIEVIAPRDPDALATLDLPPLPARPEGNAATSAKGRASFLRTSLDPRVEAMILLPEGFHPGALQRALAIRFVRQSVGAGPAWLRLGLVDHYSALQTSLDALTLGAPPPGVKLTLDRSAVQASGAGDGDPRRGEVSAQVHVDDIPPIDQLLAAAPALFGSPFGLEPRPGVGAPSMPHRVGAWALVHFLLHGPPTISGRFPDYLARVERGMPDLVPAKLLFGAQGTRAAEPLFRAHLRALAEQPQTRRTPFTWPERGKRLPDPASRALGEAELHLLWARLTPWDAGHAGAVRDHLERARATGTDEAEVTFWEGLFALHEERVDEGETLLLASNRVAPSARPLGELATLYLDRLDRSPDDEATKKKLGAIVDQLESRAETTAELNRVAWSHAVLGQGARGLPFAERAVRQRPGCWACFDTLARLFYQQRRYDQAVDAQRRALASDQLGSKKADVTQRLRCLEATAKAARARKSASEADCWQTR
ncbi:hypothetical protein [Chondromyces crocatus]|uniref:Tetratricopeptide repeat protein n=1 Tax=Chondromyces crocatus TaxID=52 RepID=A0A0K1EJE8_CHOCO|nr:hypothetical protein [Chondromyces crocatus]AKT40996.1 uncharacterized protein CMC5_051530 [Chondromyces crocatus]